MSCKYKLKTYLISLNNFIDKKKNLSSQQCSSEISHSPRLPALLTFRLQYISRHLYEKSTANLHDISRHLYEKTDTTKHVDGLWNLQCTTKWQTLSP
jgi:hypothetical protein